MFDAVRTESADRPAVFEALLHAALADHPGLIEAFEARAPVVVELPPHQLRRSTGKAEPVVSEPAAEAASWLRAATPLPGTGAVRPIAVTDSDQAAEAVSEPEPEPEPEPLVVPEMAGWAGLLEAGAGHLARAKAAHREQCRQAAVQARALAAFAAARPAAALDRPDAVVGAAAAASRAARPAVLTPVSEWAVDEVMVALRLSASAASALLGDSILLVERLPATLDALEEGTISWAHARMLADVLAPLPDDAVRREVEQRLLSRAADRTVAQLRASAKRAALHADAAAAADRLARALGQRSVRAYPGEDGMGTLAATMPLPVLRACQSVLRQYAREAAFPGDERSQDQRILDCLVDLLLRPDDPERPPVQAHLDIVVSVDTLTGGDQPGEIDGLPLPAALVRELAYALGLLPRPGMAPTTAAGASADEGAAADLATEDSATEDSATEDSATEDSATDDSATEDSATDDVSTEDAAGRAHVDESAQEGAVTGGAGPRDATRPAVAMPLADAGAAASPYELAAAGVAGLLELMSTAGTALAELPTVAITDGLSGALVALTSPTEIRRAAACSRRACRTGRTPCAHPPAGPGLGPPPDAPGYRPSEPLQRFVRARDRRCRFPGCRARAERCDLDHNVPYPAGATSCDNLCCLCRHHHRLSHQAPGWTMHRLPDGGLEWTAPGGDRTTTHPACYGTDDPPPRPPAPPGQPPPLTLRERVLGRPAARGDESAPF